ncbi:MAG: zinc dependent phospholipase C family protein [Desulfuromonadaceae bacterium]|nr:zinc dependent phospholipase C family protein [Desulfuromonadaceae bacterium]
MCKWITMLYCMCLCLIPTDVWAWGFGVHLQLGNSILAQAAHLPAHVAAVLNAFPNDFLYGCISADITLGKKYTHYLKHCHSWNMGNKVLHEAKTDAQRACAYGYIAHLGADTIAHGFMVPYEMVRSYNTVFLNHAYWELRFEARIDPQTWIQAKELAHHDFSENDKLLRRVLVRTLFSFGTNKRMFNSMLLISRIQRWQRILKHLDERSVWKLEEVERQEYLDLALAASFSVLSDPNSSYFNADPTGERALQTAHKMRASLKSLWQDGRLSSELSVPVLDDIKEHFRSNVTNPLHNI